MSIHQRKRRGYKRILQKTRKRFTSVFIDRIRAYYQQCLLQRVLRQQMTNEKLRKRFGLAEGSTNAASQIIKSAKERELIKLDPNAPSSKKGLPDTYRAGLSFILFFF